MINELQFLESHLNSPISLNAHFILSSLSSETTCPQVFINLYHPTGFYLYPLRSSFKSFFCKTSKMMERLQRDLYKLLLRDCKVTWKQGGPYPSRHKNVVTTLLRRRCPTSLWRRHIVAMETSDDVAKTTSFYLFI